MVKVHRHVNILLTPDFAKSGQNRTLSHFIQTLFTDETSMDPDTETDDKIVKNSHNEIHFIASLSGY